MTPIRLVGVGDVSLEELEARLSAYVNAGAPKPMIEGSKQEKAAVLRQVAARGDAQIRAVVESMLRE